MFKDISDFKVAITYLLAIIMAWVLAWEVSTANWIAAGIQTLAIIFITSAMYHLGQAKAYGESAKQIKEVLKEKHESLHR